METATGTASETVSRTVRVYRLKMKPATITAAARMGINQATRMDPDLTETGTAAAKNNRNYMVP
jgi:hypothetical protein